MSEAAVLKTSPKNLKKRNIPNTELWKFTEIKLHQGEFSENFQKFSEQLFSRKLQRDCFILRQVNIEKKTLISSSL